MAEAVKETVNQVVEGVKDLAVSGEKKIEEKAPKASTPYQRTSTTESRSCTRILCECKVETDSVQREAQGQVRRRGCSEASWYV
jgi:hypothetical protein